MIRLRSWAVALGLGGVGGSLFAALDLPLPWMLGALTAVTLASLGGLRPEIPASMRSVMIAVLGLMLGSAFSPDLLARIGRWSDSLLVLTLATLASGLLVTFYLRRTSKMSRVTAFFAAAPGGINEMVLTGGAMGGDERTIALSHSLRILLIVFTVPFGYRLIAHVHSVPMAESMGRLADLGGMDALVMLGSAVAGAALARLARLPAWMLTGPMLSSAGLHLAGLTAFRPPAELVVLAQLVTGASIGCRFRGLSWSDMAGMARPAMGATAIMLVLSAGAAGLLAAGGHSSFGVLLLAFVPGGIAEMCLVALALGQDVAFVSTHHVVRVVMVIMLAPPIFKLLERRESRR
ncbi:AbrB family transcriptional regulator [Paramagnetospirillum magneticum]|uniref:Ammonia monooxygenase n=1 Tax=Paramagnetospirillum magneticum (strain ATCC 700264 / AMB-1) TaxID=342108 RepID=Q2WB08_PARM1|nr:AbrB family transcriptional regulator [Paramagnetospirillum magneticum]BAE48967.1 Putative ammonia monooxygenase [Paramagnetospirillum magneticum AMB-1]